MLYSIQYIRFDPDVSGTDRRWDLRLCTFRWSRYGNCSRLDIRLVVLSRKFLLLLHPPCIQEETEVGLSGYARAAYAVIYAPDAVIAVVPVATPVLIALWLRKPGLEDEKAVARPWALE
ncbi:hypothetical protein MLD38_016049 [Melastoma candidum]|uniref:Uncharacterized protein n=1 Tax=Melastoma candidum TaxID=119954 RepID=A0ACB9RLU1_9MYRT|nr:hypothetical protein MLD38_016049 [Melastoma candidum]